VVAGLGGEADADEVARVALHHVFQRGGRGLGRARPGSLLLLLLGGRDGKPGPGRPGIVFSAARHEQHCRQAQQPARIPHPSPPIPVNQNVLNRENRTGDVMVRQTAGKEKPGRSRVFQMFQSGWNYSGWTSSACRPFWPCTTLKETCWPSCSDLKPVPWIERKWTKTSWPFSGVMKPKPLASLNHLTVPV